MCCFTFNFNHILCFIQIVCSKWYSYLWYGPLWAIGLGLSVISLQPQDQNIFDMCQTDIFRVGIGYRLFREVCVCVHALTRVHECESVFLCIYLPWCLPTVWCEDLQLRQSLERITVLKKRGLVVDVLFWEVIFTLFSMEP